jgi:dolichol kinase
MWLLHLTIGTRFVSLSAGVIFVIGDGVAALVGSTFGVTSWPWRRDKTVVGSLAFLVGAAGAMLGVLQILSDAPWTTVLLFTLVPSMIGCLCEALPVTLRDFRDAAPDDNFLILLSTGVTTYLLMHWLQPVLRPGW